MPSSLGMALVALVFLEGAFALLFMARHTLLVKGLHAA